MKERTALELKRIKPTADDDANADLPPAVRQRIVALQDSSERMISWIQLGIVVLFGAL
jgi:hypothetical protein